MFRRILVPLDGSNFAEAALPVALDLARLAGSEVRLLTVHEGAPAFAHPAWDEKSRTWTGGYLEEVEAKIRPHAGAPTSSTIREGDTAEEVCREAEAWGADLVVMATHGRGSVSRFWLGSVAVGCVRKSKRPVLLVRPPESPGAPELGTPTMPSRIVVPLDGSPLAEGVLDAATALASLSGAKVSLLRVVPYPAGPTSAYLPYTIEINRERMEEAKEKANRYLATISERLRERGLEVDATVDAAQHPAHAILEHAGRDAVAMATHGRSGLGRALMGSVADKVIRGAHGLVMTVRPKD